MRAVKEGVITTQYITVQAGCQVRGHQRGDVTNTQHITLHAVGQVKGCQGGCHYHSQSSHYYPVRVKSWNFSRLEKSGKITKYWIEVLCCCRFRLEILCGCRFSLEMLCGCRFWLEMLCCCRFSVGDLMLLQVLVRDLVLLQVSVRDLVLFEVLVTDLVLLQIPVRDPVLLQVLLEILCCCRFRLEISCCCRFRLEILRDDMALTQLSRGVWLVPHDNIILDIDEDFFGCEAAVTRFKPVRKCVCVFVCGFVRVCLCAQG